ncbi:Polyadenylate-binding protein-interacting protein 7 [Phytophthora citrophthora]|uniref:Polyadenylate-binding protein-interacting protein 7 n=1 Tax=Phytophthora citrophthora TaxID=4793 RepID=A0AAD9GV02_9STRA|nr:Polyadenylate-binding protein-interacting protein 7 [Phytophthora citrophthora]
MALSFAMHLHSPDNISTHLVSMQLLEAWATARLEALGVDGVFAPYIVGMLPSHGGDDDNLEDAKFNIHQVLMGWLAPEDEERAQEFVDELAKLENNPAQLTEAAMALAAQSNGDKRIEDDINRILAQDEELKASAPTFVPKKFLSPVVAEFHPTNSPEGSFNGGFDQLQATSPPASMPLSHLNSSEMYEEEDAEEEEEEEEDNAAMQNEDNFFWSVAYELVSHLQLKFPDIDPNRLCDLLRLVGLDVDKAHAVLKATIERESIGPGQVCRHYLQGECRRADCMFLHDTDNITCRFWLRGTCLQAEHCVFAHDFCEYYAMDDNTLGRRDYDSEDEMDQNSAPLDIQAEDMFPSLQSATSAPHSPPPPQGRDGPVLTEVLTNTYSLTDDSVADLSMNFARAVALQPTTATATMGNGVYGIDSSRRKPPVPVHRPLYHKAGEAKGLAPSQSVSTQYLDLREQAYEMACARNKCFMGATQAYRNGNKALAKGLSKQGHEYNSKMKNFHFLAASEIFESRNPPSQLYMDRMMDLHGLHVAEAVEFLTQMLPKLADEGVDSIYLVTGSGHHSKGPDGNARLLPAVERFLGNEGYQYTPVADGAGFVGMLLVDLRW